MKKIILTRGLPASGKSTWAREELKKGGYKRVNKDDLRAMLDNGVWSKFNEQFVLKVRNFIVQEALKNGCNVIVDDTNLHSKHKNEMWKIASEVGDVVVEEKDFTNVPIEECIKRDLARPNSVGEKVIRKMYNDFLAPHEPKPEPILGAPLAIMVDIDGTLALADGKDPYERDFIGDSLNLPVWKVVYNFHKDGYKILLVSGRNSKFKEETIEWLKLWKVPYDELFMPRAVDDRRKDFIVKSEVYESEIKGKYNIDFVLDDRTQVVDYWRRMGLAVFQVAPGDF